MKRVIAILIVLAVALPALGGSAGVTFTDQYRWHGVKLYGDNYLHPGVTAQVSGVDIAATSHYLNEDNDLKKWDTVLGYQLPVGGLDVRAGYGYFLLPGVDVQEISATIALPGTISPRYTIAHAVPDSGEAGQFHILGLDVGLGDTCDPNTVSGLLSADVTYNDGVSPFGGAIIRDFTHFSAGLVVNVPVGDFTLQPGVMYQHTFEELIDSDRNECWYTLGMKYRF